MSYLHNLRHPIVHGDFKPSDVLVVANGRIPKITNFGLWDFKNFFIENTMAEDVVFLNPHQAPEVLIGHERPSLCSDVWSLGAVILQWMLERPPWDLQHLCHMYQYRHDRQASALHDAMDNQVRNYDQQLKFLTEISFFCGETTEGSFTQVYYEIYKVLQRCNLF